MLATLRPTLFMDSFDPYRHHSDYNPINRHRPSGQHRSLQLQHDPSSQQPPQQPQQQLPSFKEILPPPLHSAIDSTAQAAPHHPQPSDPAGSRPAGTGLPSPIFSQSSSMPESFDDFAPRHPDSSLQIPSQQRQPSSWTASSQYTDMAATYSTQRPTYQSHGLAVSRPSPGLPPIRDIGQSLSKYSTNYDGQYLASSGTYSQVYNHSGNAQHDGNSYQQRRDSPYDYGTNRAYSSTYPAAGPAYGIRRDLGSFPQSFNDYNPSHYRGQPYEYGFSPMGINGTPSPITTGGMGDSSDRGNNRRRRGNLPKQVTDILRSWFQDHLDHPYPSEEEKQMFIQQTGLTINQISNWFINARRRHLPALRSARDGRKQDDNHHQSR